MMEKRLPEGWEWKRLGDVATVGAGNSAPQGEQYFTDGTYPFVRTKDAGREKATICLVNTTDKVNNFAVKECKLKLLPVKTLIVPKSGVSTFLNHRALLGEPSYVSSHLATVIAGNDLLPEYLYFWSLTIDAKQLTHDINYPSLRLSELGSAKIPLPSIETQRKIVAILEKAEETKKLRMQADELTSQLLQSVFLEMFGDPVINNKNWEIKTIEELSSEIVDCPHSTPKYVDYVTDFPCIRTTELKEGYIDWKVMKYLDENEYKKRVNRLIPIEGDVIYGREGSFGEAARVPANTNMSLGQRVMLFRPKPKVCNSVFLWALIRSDSIYFQALKKTSGSTVRHVNIKDIKKFKGICPPIELQNKFAQIAKKVEVMRQNQKQSQQEIDNLFNALMQKAFKGELVV
jgi:type I restriction enzyme S subunit